MIVAAAAGRLSGALAARGLMVTGRGGRGGIVRPLAAHRAAVEDQRQRAECQHERSGDDTKQADHRGVIVADACSPTASRDWDSTVQMRAPSPLSWTPPADYPA